MMFRGHQKKIYFLGITNELLLLLVLLLLLFSVGASCQVLA
jgi:hypothetical protein